MTVITSRLAFFQVMVDQDLVTMSKKRKWDDDYIRYGYNND